MNARIQQRSKEFSRHLVTRCRERLQIHFSPIPGEVVEQLLQEQGIYSCAGGLMIEHPLVAPLVRSLKGSMDSVQGLPRHLVLRLIADIAQLKQDPV